MILTSWGMLAGAIWFIGVIVGGYIGWTGARRASRKEIEMWKAAAEYHAVDAKQQHELYMNRR